MKNLLLSLLIALSFISVNAQRYAANLDMTVIKNYKKFEKSYEIYSIKKGSTYHVDSIYQITTPIPNENNANLSFYMNTPYAILEVDKDIVKHIKFDTPDIRSFWNAKVITTVLPLLTQKGSQYELRSEMEEEAFDFINKMQDNGLELSDPYLESYIYGLIAKIAPESLVDGRPCNVNLLIVQQPNPISLIYPNGTIVLSTGLISCLHSEDELVAVLANEISHFVLDHSVFNVNKSISRQKRQEFWAGLATVATTATEVAVAAKTGYYVPGVPTLAMAVATAEISDKVVDHLGMNFNREQRLEADSITKDVLRMLNYNESALCSALKRINNRFSENRIFLGNINKAKDISLPARIDNLGNTELLPANKRYEQIISFAVTSLVNMQFNMRHFRQAIALADQNINNGVACADDYLQKANCLLFLKNDRQTNIEANQLIEEAKKLDAQNVNIYRLTVLIALREDNYDLAITLLHQYLEILGIDADKPTEGQFNYRNSESYWALNMLSKIQAMRASR